jgi:hypothetical protein
VSAQVKKLRPAPPQRVSTGEIADHLDVDERWLSKALTERRDLRDIGLPTIRSQSRGRPRMHDDLGAALVAAFVDLHHPALVLDYGPRIALLRTITDVAADRPEQITVKPNSVLTIVYSPRWTIAEQIRGAR